MKKSILNLAGAKELTKAEQKSINGGKLLCRGTLIPFDTTNLPCGACAGFSTYNYASYPACCC
ncbi:hypothetical protein OX284_000295 [Flavobacterium sp. SUN046]|uniref:hypothetical protein n=1 Tax=Flavobacterium sp. SUN046 TaxID=3002440 RepID=UPI002DB78FEE|nr:hypothetical protein [Flavobacterium sp. SUN046]MEC4047852.1 hypothetical protein [Flavobacterium sp. SUN046]